MFTRTVLSAGGTTYSSPFIDGPRDVEQIEVDISDLTYNSGNGEVDADGYLKPGVFLKHDGTGTPLNGTTGEFLYGVVIEATKVATGPIAADADLDALDNPSVAVARGGLLNRDIIEDNLGRALTADELAAVTAAGSNFAITRT